MMLNFTANHQHWRFYYAAERFRWCCKIFRSTQPKAECQQIQDSNILQAQIINRQSKTNQWSQRGFRSWSIDQMPYWIYLTKSLIGLVETILKRTRWPLGDQKTFGILWTFHQNHSKRWFIKVFCVNWHYSIS